MSETAFVTREQWLNERKSLLTEEKSFTRAHDALSAKRRAMPLLKIEKPYAFQTERGMETLSDLFKEKTQLVIYHFMFASDAEEGCASCSFWMDNLESINMHLAARDTAFKIVSIAMLKKPLAYKARMGWHFDWISSGGTDFYSDFGVSFVTGELGPQGGYNYSAKGAGIEMPGISIFTKLEDATIAHGYSSFGRGLDMLNGAYQVLDLTPKGRDEGDLRFPQSWVRRRDKY